MVDKNLNSKSEHLSYFLFWKPTIFGLDYACPLLLENLPYW